MKNPRFNYRLMASEISRQGINIVKMAKTIETSRAAIYLWMTGETEPKLKWIRKIGWYLQIDPAKLLSI